MTAEKLRAIRHEKARLQKERRAWKRAHPIEAETKRISNLMDSERRAIKRDDRAAVHEYRRAIKHARWESNVSLRHVDVKGLVKGGIKPKRITKVQKIAEFFRRMVRPGKIRNRSTVKV
jgi:hypothetical protein